MGSRGEQKRLVKMSRAKVDAFLRESLYLFICRFFQIVTHQTRILMILTSLGIETEAVDITAPGMDEARDFMRDKGKKKDGERNVLPPQIFNGEKYCGVRKEGDGALSTTFIGAGVKDVAPLFNGAFFSFTGLRGL